MYVNTCWTFRLPITETLQLRMEDTARKSVKILTTLKLDSILHCRIESPYLMAVYRVSQEERSIFWEVIVSVILSKNVYMNMFPIPNGFRDRVLWMYNRKIVDKKEMLRVRSVSNTGIYCLSDRVCTVSNKCSKIPPSTSMHFANSCEDMASCSSECVLTFVYAGDNTHYFNEQFVSCIHFFFVHFTPHQTP